MPTETDAVIESTNADRSKRRLRSAAPARPPLRTIAIAFTGALVGLTGLAALTYAFGLPLLIPPLAASMASRIASTSSRRYGARQSRVFSGSSSALAESHRLLMR